MTTEEKIFMAAKAVFHKKGFAGARMQEIADEAGINKAMLHYFFKSKNQLFEAVFMNAFRQLSPQLNQIFNSDETLFVKIEKFIHNYIDYIVKNPQLPQFLINEINNNPEFLQKFMALEERPRPLKLVTQIQLEIEKGIIKPVEPKQFILDVFSMVVFPFSAQMMVRGLLEIEEKEFVEMMQKRKSHIVNQIIESIKK